MAGTWGREASLWSRAPGRVDLMGSHTDYNFGRVLTLPINRDTWVAAVPRDDGRVRIKSLQIGSAACFPLDAIEPDRDQPWSNYVRGVAAILLAERLPLRGFDGIIDSTVPIGSGLSSSAALECSIAVLFQSLGGWRVPPERLARLCQRAENDFVGVNCGILDQFTSCLGRAGCALLLDCRDLGTRPVQLAPGICVVVCDTNSPRRLSRSEYGTRRAQCEEAARLLGVPALCDVTLEQLAAFPGDLPEGPKKRARFIIEENLRVGRLARALESGDAAATGSLCAASFQGARDLYEICSPAMSAMMEAMLAAPGIMGARQAGAGFGGCMVAFVNRNTVDFFAAAVRERYSQSTGVVPMIYPVEPAEGACLLP